MPTTTKSFELSDKELPNAPILCEECFKETIHKIITSYTLKGNEEFGDAFSYQWNDTFQTVQCLGCESVSFRQVSSNSEEYYDDEHNNRQYLESEKLYPNRSTGRQIDSLQLPDQIQGIYAETVLALTNEQPILAGIGVRALVESVCKEQNTDGRNLFERIDSLHEKSIITSEQRDALHALRVLGNDAAHETKAHSISKLKLAVEIIEHMLEGAYIFPKKFKKVFGNN